MESRSEGGEDEVWHRGFTTSRIAEEGIAGGICRRSAASGRGTRAQSDAVDDLLALATPASVQHESYFSGIGAIF